MSKTFKPYSCLLTGFFIFLALNPALSAASKPFKYGLFPEELISLKDLRDKQIKKEKFILLDARGKQSYDEGHIIHALLPLSEAYYVNEELFRKGIVKSAPDRDKDLVESTKKYLKNAPIVAYCNDHCQASAVLVLQLKHLGFTNVRAMDGGFQTWSARGYPVSSRLRAK